MPAVPAGAILKRILQKERLSQKELAFRSDVYPQRINDLIYGKRKFTVELSFRLEKALGIATPGYFYRVQANYDIYCHVDAQERKHTPDLSIINRSLFWEASSIDSINWIKNANWVVQRAFEYGNRQEIEEIIRYYGREKVSDILNKIPKGDIWKEKDRQKNRNIFEI